MNFRAGVILGSLAILNGAFLAQAQIDRATLTGTLHDPAGAAVAGAKVTLTYRDTGVTRSVTSNESGAYLISGLPLGSVVIEAQQSGFRMLRSETKLNVGETLTLDLTFELATVDNSVQVVADVDLERSSAAIGQTFQNNQLQQLPVNGRNFENLMALVPGAVDTGAGNGSSVRFFGHGGDDNNFRIDGVDATSVRNQTQAKSRLVISMDAIAEFRVNAALYSAETGGASGGQVEVVSKGGTNILHGSLFEYFRNSILDSRSPFDGKTVPAFRLNQFGATLGGPVRRDRTFFFLSYEGLIQRQGRTQIGFVPDAAFRASAPAALQPLLALYPVGQIPTNIRNVLQWTGVGSATQDEHSGLARLDHRFTDKLSGYFRFSKNDTVIFSPNAALPYGTSNLDAPTSGLFDFLYLVSPRTTNELRLAANYSQPLNSIPTGAPASISIPSLSTIPGGNRRIAIGISESLVDQWATLRGPHTVKAGIEIRRVQLNVHDFNLSDATASYASLADFQSNRLNTLAGSGELPTKGLRKIEYFGYIQDEWKIKPNFIANIGLRYEFYNRFSERNNRDVPFDIQACGGYCRPGSEFAYPDLNNFGPRLSLAWSPAALRDRTVIRAGGGIYYGDAQLGDQYSPANNDAVRYTLSQATTPGLSYPFDSFINATGALATAPRSNPLNRRNQVSQQWGFSIQHALNARVSATVSYSGQKGTHVFSRTYVNVLDPVTQAAPLARHRSSGSARGRRCLKLSRVHLVPSGKQLAWAAGWRELRLVTRYQRRLFRRWRVRWRTPKRRLPFLR